MTQTSIPTNLKNKLEQARYMVQGLKWSVIPVGIDKKPYKGLQWTEYQNRRATQKELEDWFTNSSDDVGIAVITGAISDIVVVDIDPRNGGDNKMFNRTITVSVNTGGGGWHYYFKYHHSIKSLDIKDKGFEVKSDGRYVIVPPSKHVSGKIYGWKNSPHAETLIIDFPDFVKDFINKHKNTSNHSQGVSQFESSIIQGVEEGSRHTSACSLIGKLLHSQPETEWNEIIWPLVEAWNKKNATPLPDKELCKIYEGIAKKELSRRNTQCIAHNNSDSAMQWIEPVNILDLSDSEGEKPDWIWEGYIARGHITLFSALWKAGKSTLLGHLINATMKGFELTGQQVKKCNTLVVSEESKQNWLKRKTEHEYNNQLFLSCRPTKTRMNVQSWGAFIEHYLNFCKDNNIEVIIFDTIGTFWPIKDENSATDVTNAILPLYTLTEAGIAVVLVHHLKKGDGQEATGSRGSGALPSSVDIILELRRKEKEDMYNNCRVLRTYGRFEESPKERVIELTDVGYVSLGEPWQVAQDEKHEIYLSVLSSKKDEGMTVDEIREALSYQMKKPDRTTVSRNMKKLETKNMAKIVGKKDTRGKPDMWVKCNESGYEYKPLE